MWVVAFSVFFFANKRQLVQSAGSPQPRLATLGALVGQVLPGGCDLPARSAIAKSHGTFHSRRALRSRRSPSWPLGSVLGVCASRLGHECGRRAAIGGHLIDLAHAAVLERDLPAVR